MARLYCSFLSVSALEKKWGYLEISSVQPSAATLKSAARYCYIAVEPFAVIRSSYIAG